MRLGTFIQEGVTRAGIYDGGGYYTFRNILGDNAPGSVLAFIQAYEGRRLPDLPAMARGQGLRPIPAENVRLLAPMPFPPRNVICLGKNYLEHAREVSQTILHTQDAAGVPSAPVYFAKNASPATGYGDMIPLHGHFTQQVDYEVELAVIIGRRARNIDPVDVEDTIFGYTVLNDVTARDVQSAYGQWYFGKSLDGFCPMGPHIVTRDELPFPVELDITCRVNGELRQSSNTALLIYDIPRVISELSRGMTLLPGDVIATGTPGGIGHAKKPPVYLKTGDVVECAIAGVGTLRNTVGE